jgi:hypothetical protein
MPVIELTAVKCDFAGCRHLSKDGYCSRGEIRIISVASGEPNKTIAMCFDRETRPVTREDKEKLYAAFIDKFVADKYIKQMKDDIPTIPDEILDSKVNMIYQQLMWTSK